jgi:GNAT superfamily N-acetyltransferase/predicted nucleic acid-binding protein
MRISITQSSEKYLDKIIRLWRKHSDTLGFFPEGAFEEYCRKKQILLAHSETDELVGYLIFRHSRNETTIVHLCVNQSYRSTGVAHKLLHKLIESSNNSRGIGLKCRRDYNLSGFWSSLGFIARADITGRAKEPTSLTKWWMDFGHPNLFSLSINEQLQNKSCVVIDANIFYGIYSNEKEDDEAKSLVADWIPESIELCLTDEIYNEIDRRNSLEERNRNRKRAAKFTELPYNAKRSLNIEIELENLIGKAKTDSKKSDLRHLSKSISGGALYFITRDRKILRHADSLYEKFQISLLRPCDMIIELDQIEHGHDYQPARLSGTQYRIRLITAGELDAIVSSFLCTKKGEKAHELKEFLARETSNPRRSSCSVLSSPDGDYQALFVHSFIKSECKIKLFRVAQSPLAATIGRHLLRRLALDTAKRNTPFIVIQDGFMDENLFSILTNDGFILAEGYWLKLALWGHYDTNALTQKITQLSLQFPSIKNALDTVLERISIATTSNDNINIAYLEKMLWPALIIGFDIPTYIVPIKPKWAQHLFDEYMASHDLFGAGDLIFNAELVYYRSKRPGGIVAPGRIIWYASQEKNHPGAGSIRAISLLNEVTTGLPKQLYAQYRRLGVYGWQEILDTANNDINCELMALKFSCSQMLDKPIMWKDLQQLLGKHDIKSNLQSPLRISNEVVYDILQRAQGNKGSSTCQIKC